MLDGGSREVGPSPPTSSHCHLRQRHGLLKKEELNGEMPSQFGMRDNGKKCKKARSGLEI